MTRVHIPREVRPTAAPSPQSPAMPNQLQPSPPGIRLRHRGREVALKWHMLRRAPEDPAFCRTNLREGLARGAVLEVDLVFSADGDGVCLHDPTLDRETTGTGRVRDHATASIRALRQRGHDGAPLVTAPLLLDELLQAVRGAPPGSPSVIQLDLKEPPPGLTDAVRFRFAAAVGPLAPRFILSGDDWAAVRDLAHDVPGLRLGFDPLCLYDDSWPRTPSEFRDLARRTLDAAPEAAIVYLEADLVLRGLGVGVNLLDPMHAAGKPVDCWTVDPRPDTARRLTALIEAGADQITTNAPEALERLWQEATA